ncbi:cellulase family glycosylhydrolase [Sunxiuqinia sp. sy24]|uniref:cellulase family glycosylhydrolase n=1 Tax=Sunxiuqinia sp. sy24 TaxID=3461495 RepID=UPI004045F49D
MLRKSIRITNLLIVGMALLLAACGERETGSRQTIFPETISVEGTQFVDNNGRQVILNGINVVSKSREENYLFRGGPEFYANLKKWGFNSIRFIIIWDGLEPEPGVYNEEYLEEIDQRIEWAADNGIFVILDMHQDLFGLKYSDGAPNWATLDEGKTHVTGSIWSDAYMLSEAVQTAFDNFWANKSAPDGVGVQDHYANLWKHIAKRYANNPAVIGYDIMNEPFPGTSAQMATLALLEAYAGLVYKLTGELLTEDKLAETWGDASMRTEALKLLSTKENYAPVIDALHDINHEFESTHLQSMYQKVSHAIREVDMQRILFLEHSYFSNTGVKSSIERVTLADGTPDPFVAYAPHGYDLVTDTEDAAVANSERVAFIYERIKEKGQQLGMPVWLGEWGAYYSHSDGIVPVARYAVSLIEENLFGNAYWSYDPGTESLSYFQKALLRPYPSYTCGELLSYQYDHETAQFKMEWLENEKINSPTMVYVPSLSELKEASSYKIEKINNSDAGWVVIPHNEKKSKRELILQF